MQNLTDSRPIINTIPGTITYSGNKDIDFSVDVISFDKNNYRCVTHDRPSKIKYPFEVHDQLHWVNMIGLNQTEAIARIGDMFNLHPLLLEDIVNVQQRPRLDELDKQLFITLKMIYERNGVNTIEHLSLVMGPGYVLTFQEAEGDVFGEVRQRIEKDRGRIRKMGSDYLLYALLDAIVDNYVVVIEDIGERIETLENDLFVKSEGHQPQEIQDLKREMIRMRKAIHPVREIVNRMQDEDEYVSKVVNQYYRDLYDHMIQVTESLEVYREMTGNLMDMYMTQMSNRMNEVMKTLTIVSAIFIPLTFMAGIYGMNFENIPELQAPNGYFILLGAMVVVTLLMIWYFKRRNWF